MGVADDFKPHAVLKGTQRDASHPDDHVWLSASAGTGKTYVLSARVLRLLLRGVKPDAILCLTFTKAGAAEMAERVHARLASWVRLDDTLLFNELEALGEAAGPEEVAKARTLFATVLESKSGGLRIMTIHAFCQTLLAGFPIEAGLTPGFRQVEGREQAALADSVLADLIVTARREGDQGLLDDFGTLSRALGEGDAKGFVMRAASSLDALNQVGPRLPAIVSRAVIGVTDFRMEDLVDACADGAFDRVSLQRVAQANRDWATKTGLEAAEAISDWLGRDPVARLDGLDNLARVWTTQKGTRRTGGPKDVDYAPAVDRVADWCDDLLATRKRAILAEQIRAALNAAWRFASAYDRAKRTRGLVDFDDLIKRARDLLSEPGMGEWIRFKLDQATDHILIDEAQDTNQSQWTIVEALTDEFWAGDGAKPDTLRTVFAVGDYKQAIFGFQGTDPRYYDEAGRAFRNRARDSDQTMLGLSLTQSFRSAAPVLTVVDATLAGLGSEALGAIDSSEPHQTARLGVPGSVVLWPPVSAETATDDDGDDEEQWASDAVRALASRIATQVRTWIDDGVTVAKDGGRAMRAGDIMILVRSRSTLAALIVARLVEEGVPVAGVDRLLLREPLAVQDLIAAARFAVQPGDDLNLGGLLVSPLVGWSQDDLYAAAYGRKGTLWDAVPAGATRDALLAILNAADFVTPYAFFEGLLSGPLQGRKKLLRRLGPDARDPIDELLSATLAFQAQGIASLEQFLHWFDTGEGEVVRDPDASGDAVRVMTVHAAKGLEAPIVILADATTDPNRKREQWAKWKIEEVAEELPLYSIRQAERRLVASLETSAADAKLRARQEHWRLLYVAMTRAAERLFVTGALGAQAKGEVPADSWYQAVANAIDTVGAVERTSPVWGGERLVGDNLVADTVLPVIATAAARAVSARPAWLDRVAPAEARPPRPLAPSSIGEDREAMPPPSDALAAAARRGVALHALFERLPALPTAQRRAAAEAWLAANGDDPALADVALAVISDPAFAFVFADNALAEAPVAGVVDGLVISGTIDRLAVSDDRVEIVDFKTGTRVPNSIDDVPVRYLRQMAAYAALMAQIYPGRAVRTSLLYTAGPVMLTLTEALLQAHKPGFATGQENLIADG